MSMSLFLIMFGLMVFSPLGWHLYQTRPLRRRDEALGLLGLEVRNERHGKRAVASGALADHRVVVQCEQLRGGVQHIGVDVFFERDMTDGWIATFSTHQAARVGDPIATLRRDDRAPLAFHESWPLGALTDRAFIDPFMAAQQGDAKLQRLEVHPNRVRWVWEASVEETTALARLAAEVSPLWRWVPGDEIELLRRLALLGKGGTDEEWRRARQDRRRAVDRLFDLRARVSGDEALTEALRAILLAWPIAEAIPVILEHPSEAFGLLSAREWLDLWNHDWQLRDPTSRPRADRFGAMMRYMDEGLIEQGRGDAFLSFWTHTGLPQCVWSLGREDLVTCHVWLIGTDARRARIEQCILDCLEHLIAPEDHRLKGLFHEAEHRLALVSLLERLGTQRAQIWAMQAVANDRVAEARLRAALVRMADRLSEHLGDWRDIKTQGALTLAEDDGARGGLSVASASDGALTVSED